MSVLEDIKRRYGEMDEIDRKNFWIAVGFGVLIIILIFTLSDAFYTVGGILGSSANYVNKSVGDASKLGKTP